MSEIDEREPWPIIIITTIIIILVIFNLLFLNITYSSKPEYVTSRPINVVSTGTVSESQCPVKRPSKYGGTADAALASAGVEAEK